jgi:hypothetical protein
MHCSVGEAATGNHEPDRRAAHELAEQPCSGVLALYRLHKSGNNEQLETAHHTPDTVQEVGQMDKYEVEDAASKDVWV